jgi:clan AA aspartic protease
MGLVYATTEITNIAGGEGKYTMPFLVDTGATDSIIPSNELERLGIKREAKRNYELADGTVVSYDIGYAFICVNGEKVAGNVIFGEDNIDPLLGVTVLESAGFIIDPVRQVLKKTAAIPLKGAVREDERQPCCTLS